MNNAVSHFIAPNFLAQGPAFRFLWLLQQLHLCGRNPCLLTVPFLCLAPDHPVPSACHTLPQGLQFWLVVSLLLCKCQANLLKEVFPGLSTFCPIDRWVALLFVSMSRDPLPANGILETRDLFCLAVWGIPGALSSAGTDYCPADVSWVNGQTKTYIHWSRKACWAPIILGTVGLRKAVLYCRLLLWPGDILCRLFSWIEWKCSQREKSSGSLLELVFLFMFRLG